MANEIPARMVQRDEAKAEFGPMVERMGHWLKQTDPVADELVDATRAWPRVRLFRTVEDAIRGGEVPPELEPLMTQIETLPVWVDFERYDRGSDFFMSTHALGGLVLGAKCLVRGYASPAGNKPLVLSGRLERGVNRRLAETAKFLFDVTKPGGMRPGGDGVVAATKVRLIHAKVRQMIHQKCEWNDDWGEPINQHDMLGTVLLFSLTLVQGLETLGLKPTYQEGEDFTALWRYIGYILGVDEELLPATRAEAERYDDFIAMTQGPPDDDARELTRVFLDAPNAEAMDDDHESAARPNALVGYAIARELLGEEMSDQLAIPTSPLSIALPIVRSLVKRLNKLRRLSRGQRIAAERGVQYWQWVLDSQPSSAIELTLPIDMLRSRIDAA